MTRLTKELIEKDGQQSQKSSFKRLFKGGRTHPGTASEADTMSHMVRSSCRDNLANLPCNVSPCNVVADYANPQPEVLYSAVKRNKRLPTGHSPSLAQHGSQSFHRMIACSCADHAHQKEEGQDASRRDWRSLIRIIWSLLRRNCRFFRLLVSYRGSARCVESGHVCYIYSCVGTHTMCCWYRNSLTALWPIHLPSSVMLLTRSLPD